MVLSSGRLKEGGRLVVAKEDFNAHWQTGTAFRHVANQLDMSPQIPGVGGVTVQETLENLTDIITSAGSGFISIGQADGYASGIYNVGTVETPTFTDAFNAAQADDRLINGGIIMVMAGSYVITTSVTVNPGITVIGELGGTYLISETTEQSMFIVSSYTKDLNVGGDSGSGDLDIISGTNVDKIKFYNLIMFDNLNETTASSSTMVTVPMISLQQGGNLECEQVSFFGKVNDGAIVNRSKTKCAIGTISGVSAATSLQVKNCFFDGVRNGIIFTPQAGDLDYLSVTNCKGRFFGKESASYTADEDSFIYASLCTANVSNNYITAGHANAKTLVNFTTTGGSTLRLRVIVVGNIGNLTVSSPSLIDNDSGVTFNGIVNSNNWGVNVGNPWYIVVGGADGDNPAGDIFGPNAVNTIVSWANTLGLEATVIVNPGTYTVTVSSSASSNVANLKFIGNKKGRNYPIFQLAIAASSTDNIGNKFLVLGNHLESIYFISTGAFQSVRPSFDPIGISSQNAAHTIVVKDCVFTNTSLNVLDITAAMLDQLGNTTSTIISIDNCHFDQTGSFADNISLVTCIAHITLIKNCYFMGIGYAFNVGQESYGGSAGTTEGILSFENIIIDRSAGITTSAPGSLTTDKCCIIKDTTASLAMENCQIFIAKDNITTSPIGGTLLTAGTFEAFIYIEANNVSLTNCFFNGPNQSFVSGGVTYALPCVQIISNSSLFIDNCKFHSGGLPLQIKSTLPVVQGSNFVISKSSFQAVTDDPGTTITMLDCDIEKSGVITSNPIEVNISNCSFILTALTESARQIKHTNVTGATYDGHGIVQIYSKGIDVNFCNNRIWGSLYAPIVNPYTHISGLMINTYSSDAGNSTWSTSCIVANNNIKIHTNNYSIASAAATASCVFVRTSVANINNNVFEFSNAMAALASFAGCLALDIRAIGGFGDGTVTNNWFGNFDTAGSFTLLSRGYVTILSTTTVRGKIVNNSFGSVTIDGVSNTTLVEDSTSTAATHWLITSNKNQTVTITANGTLGKQGLRDSSSVLNTEAGIVPSVTASNSRFIWSSVNSVYFDYLDTGNEEIFVWTIPVYTLVPHGAYIVSISVPVDVSSNPSGDSIATLRYRDTSSSSSDVSNPLTISGDTLSLSFATNARPNLPELIPTIELDWQVNGASTSGLTAEVMTITYRW